MDSASRICICQQVIAEAWMMCSKLCSIAARGLGLAINRSRVRLPATAFPGSDPGQVVHAHDQYDHVAL